MFLGIICILLGVIAIYTTYKTPEVEFSEGNISPKIKGYGGGLGLIIVGISFIIDWFSS